MAGPGSDRALAGPRRILVRLPNWLGDALMARPLLHGLRRAHAAAQIRVVGPGPLIGLLAPERTFDDGLEWLRGRGERVADARATLGRSLRRWSPDAALILPFSFSSAWFAWRIAARIRIGYAHELRSPFLTHALRRPARGERHLSREYLELGRMIGVRPVELPALVPSPDGEAAAGALLERAAPGAGRLAVLAPRSAYGPARQWPADRFAALARRLVGRGHTVLVCGTAAEGETCRQVADQAGSGTTSVAGETDLPTLVALVRRSVLAVCNDSGLAHLAGAVGTPTVTLYGSTSSAWTAALGPRVRVVQHPPVCSPCFRRTCRIGYACLAAIGVEEVDAVAREAAS